MIQLKEADDIMKKITFAILLTTIMMLSSCSVQDETGKPETTEITAESAVPENTSGLTSPNHFNAATLSGVGYSDAYFDDHDVTIINIWSTTCPPCIAEMPELTEFMHGLPDNVQLITWCLDGDYNTERAESIIEDAGYDGVTLTAGDGDLQTLLYELMYTPTTLFVDCDGNIIGDALIGSPRNFAGAYTQMTNNALKAIGKEEMP